MFKNSNYHVFTTAKAEHVFAFTGKWDPPNMGQQPYDGPPGTAPGRFVKDEARNRWVEDKTHRRTHRSDLRAGLLILSTRAVGSGLQLPAKSVSR